MSKFEFNLIDNVVLVTLNNIPNTAESLAKIFTAIGESKINLDMICQTAPYKNKINLSFTIDECDLTNMLNVVSIIKNEINGLVTELSSANSKITMLGECLKTEWGVAGKLFGILNKNDTVIKLITTSDVEISLLLDNENSEKIFKILKKEFSN